VPDPDRTHECSRPTADKSGTLNSNVGVWQIAPSGLCRSAINLRSCQRADIPTEELASLVSLQRPRRCSLASASALRYRACTSRRAFTYIFGVNPSHPISDLLQVDIDVVQHEHGQRAAVAVSTKDMQFHVSAKDVLAQVLFGRLSESLALSRVRRCCEGARGAKDHRLPAHEWYRHRLCPQLAPTRPTPAILSTTPKMLRPSRYGPSVWRMSKPMISFVLRTPVRRTTRFASDWLFLTDAYGSNINAAPAISVGTRAPRKRYSGEIPAFPNREARID
jgi:hypothetical protein